MSTCNITKFCAFYKTLCDFNKDGAGKASCHSWPQSSLLRGQEEEETSFPKSHDRAFKVASWPTFLEVSVADFNDRYFYRVKFGQEVASFLDSFYFVKTSSGYARKIIS